MQLLVIRHAIAEDREVFARKEPRDELRPITRAGARRMRVAAGGIARLAKRPDVLATSPLVRAAQTAAIVAREWGGIEPITVEALAPGGRRSAILAWLRAQREADTIAIVGHEAGLGRLVTWLIAGVGDKRLALKKGGACCVQFDGRPGAGAGVLTWLLTPAQLRRLGK